MLAPLRSRKSAVLRLHLSSRYQTDQHFVRCRSAPDWLPVYFKTILEINSTKQAYCFTSSTRRFLALPFSASLEATGASDPTP
jgi:hypothetical protein